MTAPEPRFTRSKRFGIVGVVVVAVLSAAIALLFGADSAQPTGALVAILSLIFGFVACLLYLQRRDLERAAVRPVAPATGPVEDPTTVAPEALLAALAVKPIDQEAIAAAGARTWDTARGSQRSAAILIALIFCAVVPWLLFTAYWSIYVFVPLIVGYVGFLARQAIGPGGQLDRAYEDSAATLEPLGLRLTERPQVEVEQRLAGPGAKPEIVGALAYEGKRHGCRVAVRIEDGDAATFVAAPVTPFALEERGGRLAPVGDAPPAVAQALALLRPSAAWQGVAVTGSSEGITVERRRGSQHWLCDLWLAERLAETLSAGAPG